MALRARLTPMIARDPREPHRVASSLELSIDAVVGTAEYSPLVVRLAYMIPVMIFLFGSWLLVAWPQAPRSLRVASVVLGILMLATCCLPVGAPWFALLPTGFAVAFVVTLILGEPAKV